MVKKVIRILLGPDSSPQTIPINKALDRLKSLDIIKKTDEIEKKTLKEIRCERWTSAAFISWGKGADLPPGTKFIFICSSHPLQLDDPPQWDHLQHLEDMRKSFQGTNFISSKFHIIV